MEFLAFLVFATIFAVVLSFVFYKHSKFVFYKLIQHKNDEIDRKFESDLRYRRLLERNKQDDTSSIHIGSIQCTQGYINPYVNKDSELSLSEWLAFKQRHGNIFVYHYTSRQNCNSILRDGMIRAVLPKVFHLGKGVFFTVNSPEENDFALIKNNYIHYSYKYLKNVECAIAIRVDQINLKKMRNRDGRDVWKCDSDIDLNRTSYIVVNRKDSCSF
jgi:hypothetical protein